MKLSQINTDEYEEVEISWGEIRESDIILGPDPDDGFLVTDVEEPQMRSCYKLKVQGHDPIVVSADHLMSFMLLTNNRSEFGKTRLNGKLLHSQEVREFVGESDETWVTAQDIFEFQELCSSIVSFPTGEPLEWISEYKSGEVQSTRCITTDMGFYSMEGILHHNCARLMFYGLSDLQVAEDCGGDHSKGVLGCKCPEGNICEACSKQTRGGGQARAGELIGGLVSTNASEPLTQMAMSKTHVGTAEQQRGSDHSAVVIATLKGWRTSPIIEAAAKQPDQESMRQVLFDGLKSEYQAAGVDLDDFNIAVIVRKMTSYRRGPDGLMPVAEGELPTIAGMGQIGQRQNIFKRAELSAGYRIISKPMSQTTSPDAANSIIM